MKLRLRDWVQIVVFAYESDEAGGTAMIVNLVLIGLAVAPRRCLTAPVLAASTRR